MLVASFQACKSVPFYAQRLLSKPNMTFSDSLTYSYQPRLTVQVEPGSASWGGAQVTGWCWTSQSVYPFMDYWSGSPGWLYYQTGSGDPRYFYDFSTESWDAR